MMMQEEGEKIGRFKVRSLMLELVLLSKKPGAIWQPSIPPEIVALSYAPEHEPPRQLLG